MKVGLIGAGSWACALANLLCERGHALYWWVHTPEIADSLQRRGKHPRIFPEHTFPTESLAMVSTDLDAILQNGEVAVLALSSQYVSAVLDQVSLPGYPWISCTKGLLPGTGERPTQYLLRHGVRQVAILSGPSYAEEVIQRRPTWVGLGTHQPALYDIARQLFEHRYFHLVYTPAPIALEWVGILKNIYAIGIGAVSLLGDNARAAAAAVMLKELAHTLEKWVPEEQIDFLSAGAAGDFLVTAFGLHSRNQRLGQYLAQGYSPKAALHHLGIVAEGYYAAQLLAGKIHPETPILYGIVQVLIGARPSSELREIILSRISG